MWGSVQVEQDKHRRPEHGLLFNMPTLVKILNVVCNGPMTADMSGVSKRVGLEKLSRSVACANWNSAAFPDLGVFNCTERKTFDNQSSITVPLRGWVGWWSKIG